MLPRHMPRAPPFLQRVFVICAFSSAASSLRSFAAVQFAKCLRLYVSHLRRLRSLSLTLGRSYTACLQLRADDLPCMDGLSMLFLRTGSPAAAVPLLEKIAGVAGGGALINLGIAYKNLRRFDEALQTYAKVKSLEVGRRGRCRRICCSACCDARAGAGERCERLESFVPHPVPRFLTAIVF